MAAAVWLLISLLILCVAYQSKKRKGEICFGIVIAFLIALAPSAEEIGTKIIKIARHLL